MNHIGVNSARPSILNLDRQQFQHSCDFEIAFVEFQKRPFRVLLCCLEHLPNIGWKRTLLDLRDSPRSKKHSVREIAIPWKKIEEASLLLQADQIPPRRLRELPLKTDSLVFELERNDCFFKQLVRSTQSLP